MSTMKPLVVSKTNLSNITPKGKVALMPSSNNANLATVTSTVASRQVLAHLEKPKRKRQRLDHLTQEEKVMRRKLKNRMAAQSARDRKKVKMMDLEGEVERLSNENTQLTRRNATLIVRLRTVERENDELRARIGMAPLSGTQKYEMALSSSGDEEDSNCSYESEMQFKTEPSEGCSPIQLMEITESRTEATGSPTTSEASLDNAFESAALISVPQQQEQASVSKWELSLSSARPTSTRRNSKSNNKNKNQTVEKCSTLKTSSRSTRSLIAPEVPSEALSTTQSYWTTLLMVLLTSLMSSSNSSGEMTGTSPKHNPMIVSMLRALAEQEPTLASLVSKALGSVTETPPASPERTVEVRPEVIEQLLSQKRVRLRS